MNAAQEALNAAVAAMRPQLLWHYNDKLSDGALKNIFDLSVEYPLEKEADRILESEGYFYQVKDYVEVLTGRGFDEEDARQAVEESLDFNLDQLVRNSHNELIVLYLPVEVDPLGHDVSEKKGGHALYRKIKHIAKEDWQQEVDNASYGGIICAPMYLNVFDFYKKRDLLRKEVLLKKGTCLAIYDREGGSGGTIEMKLTEDLHLQSRHHAYEFDMARGGMNRWGYALESTYGLYGPAFKMEVPTK